MEKLEKKQRGWGISSLTRTALLPTADLAITASKVFLRKTNDLT